MAFTKTRAVLIGDSGVGKTCICNRLETGLYSENPEPTVGAMFAKIQVSSEDGVRYTVDLWDTAGQDQFKTIVPMFFKGADFILAVYAVDNRASFDNLREWINTARAEAQETSKLFIIGNKCDLNRTRRISPEELGDFAKSMGGTFWTETSAKTGAGLDLLLQDLADEWSKVLEGRSRSPVEPTGVDVTLAPSGNAGSATRTCCK